jgi:hypothetical protein
MITRSEVMTGIGVLTLAVATLPHPRQSAAAARTSKVAVSGDNATYAAPKSPVAQDFSPDDAAEAAEAGRLAEAFDRLVTAR